MQQSNEPQVVKATGLQPVSARTKKLTELQKKFEDAWRDRPTDILCTKREAKHFFYKGQQGFQSVEAKRLASKVTEK